MKRLMVLLMLLLTVCSSTLAESIDDVLKDCKLDKNRWKVVEWYKADSFVRFYDSDSLSVTGPGQFDVTISDYYYGTTCRKDSCAQLGSKHYHLEKWGFNSAESKGTLRSFSTQDANGDTVNTYDYPANMQIATELNKKSIETKTMLKIKDSLKADKTFTSEVPKQDKPKADNHYGRFAPLPQPIGSSDGEWVYLGRFIGTSGNTYLEAILNMKPFESTTARDGVFDVYYNHTHDRCKYYETGYSYGCILKFVPLDTNGNKLQRRGVYTELVDIGGGTKGAFAGSVKNVRRYDTATHELTETLVRDGYKDSELNPVTNYGYKGAVFSGVADSPFWRAFNNSKCPGDDGWKRR